MINRFTHNWSLKLTALILSVALWSHVRGEVNPWEVASFKVRLSYDVPKKYVLQDGEKLPRLITVAVRAPRQTLRQLKGGAPANPLLAVDDAVLITSRQLRAGLDFSTPRKGVQKVPVKVESSWEDVEVIGSKPSEVTVTLDVAMRQSAKVEPEFDLPREWRATEIIPSVRTVQISGASRVLERVDRVRAEVDVKEKVSAPGALQANAVTLEAVDENGEIVEGLRFEPSTVSIKAKIVEALQEKTVSVRPVTEGRPARGYTLRDVEIEPESLTIRGPRRLLENIQSLSAILDISGARDDVSRRVRVTLPRGVEFVEGNRVRVRARIAPSPKPVELQHDAGAPPTDVSPDSLPPSPADTENP